MGTLGGPILRDKLWFFSAFENVRENASIAYSPASTTQFDALAALAADGLVPGVPSITVPAFVPIPFRDYFGSNRFDYAQSRRSSWYLRGTVDTTRRITTWCSRARCPVQGCSRTTTISVWS